MLFSAASPILEMITILKPGYLGSGGVLQGERQGVEICTRHMYASNGRPGIAQEMPDPRQPGRVLGLHQD